MVVGAAAVLAGTAVVVAGRAAVVRSKCYGVKKWSLSRSGTLESHRSRCECW